MTDSEMWLPAGSTNEVFAGTVFAGQIAAGAITAREINVTAVQAAVVTSEKVNTLSLNASVIKAGTIDTARLNAGEIQAAVVTAAKVNALELNAVKITGGNITGVSITGQTITGGIIQTAAAGSGRSRIILDGVNDWERIKFESASAYEMFPSSIFVGSASHDVQLTIWGPLSSWSGGGMWPQPSVELRGLGDGSTKITADAAVILLTGDVKCGRIWTDPWYSATSIDGVWIQDSGSPGYRMKVYFDNTVGTHGRFYVCRANQRHYINADGSF